MLSSSSFIFSDGGLPSGLPYYVCPLQPLALLGLIVACLHAIAGLNFIKHNRDMEIAILAPT
jgi:hypothetical protein